MRYRERLTHLINAMRSFGPVSARMVTLTVDPALFETPEEAWEFVGTKRKIGELARAMGWKNYVIALEFHRNGDRWPHWHLIVLHQLHRPPFECFRRLRRVWGLGRVHVSTSSELRSFQRNPLLAAKYATKYLVKPDPHGVPAWVKRRTRVRMLQLSRSLGSLSDPSPAGLEPDDGHDTDRRPERTIGAALSDCAQGITILQERREQRPGYPLADVRRAYQDGAPMPFRWFRRYVERVAPECLSPGKSSVFVPQGHWLWSRLRGALFLV